MPDPKPTPPPTAEDFQRIAAAIRDAADIGKRLKACGLSERAVIVLLADITNVNKSDIRFVLNGLAMLGRHALT